MDFPEPVPSAEGSEHVSAQSDDRCKALPPARYAAVFAGVVWTFPCIHSNQCHDRHS